LFCVAGWFFGVEKRSGTWYSVVGILTRVSGDNGSW